MKLFFIAIFILATMSTSACDICGCSSSNNSLGLLPTINKHFIGFRFQTNHFYSTPHETDGTKYAASNEYFKTIEIWGRYSISKRLQLLGFVPYKFNKRSNGLFNVELQGISDASILLNYQLIKLDNTKTWKQNLWVGAGLKLPTGNYSVVQNHLFVNENLQVGTGSIDFPMGVNYTIKKNKLGVNTDVNYKINSVNKQHFQFGNKMSSALRLFYQTTYKELTFIPQVALNYDHNESNFRNKLKEDFTKGYGIQNQIGIDIYYKKIGWNFQYSIPIKNNYGEGHIENKQRISTHIIYLF